MTKIIIKSTPLKLECIIKHDEKYMMYRKIILPVGYKNPPQTTKLTRIINTTHAIPKEQNTNKN